MALRNAYALMYQRPAREVSAVTGFGATGFDNSNIGTSNLPDRKDAAR
jgi:hypothetical protein